MRWHYPTRLHGTAVLIPQLCVIVLEDVGSEGAQTTLADDTLKNKSRVSVGTATTKARKCGSI